METSILIALIITIGTISFFFIRNIVNSIKKAKQELKQLEREKIQREETFDDCVDYGKV